MTNEAQKQFDEIYISSTEICQILDISRSSLVAARKRGILPEPITIAGALVFIWKRAEIKDALAAWQFTLKARRGELRGETCDSNS